ncbi:hypothetical protein D3C81_1498070 [compost metagenome]
MIVNERIEHPADAGDNFGRIDRLPVQNAFQQNGIQVILLCKEAVESLGNRLN